MSPTQQKPILHGRDHGCGGADPIPNICLLNGPAGSFAERVLEQPSLVGYWPMDDASGNAHDASGNGRPLTKVGTPAYGVGGALPDSPQTAIALTGADGYSSYDDSFAGNYAPLNLAGGDMTVMFYIYPSSYPALDGGITHYGDATSSAGVAHIAQIRPTGKIFWSVGATQQAQSTPSVPLAAWTHVACTRDASGLRIYFNGVLVGTATSEAIHNCGAATRFTVGEQQSAAGYVSHYLGRVAHVALFSAALSASQIAGIWNGGLDGSGAGSVLTTDSGGNPAWGPAPASPGVPTGGTSGQVLTKTSSTDYATSWQTPAGGSSSPALDTLVWLPLTTTVAGDDVLVFDASHSLIPTLTAI